MKTLPDDLKQVANSLVAHVNQGSPIPKNIIDLVQWIETEGLEDLIASWDREEVALRLVEFAQTRFTDRNLSDHNDGDNLITDAQRVAFARKLIDDQFLRGDDGWLVSSIHPLKLANTSGENAFLGWLVEIHGQGGEVPIYRGAHASIEEFLQSLREADFLLMGEKDTLEDQKLLALWQK